jgi:type I restriction enzyme S subunit
MDNLNAAMVSRLRVPLPPIEEQCKIMESIAHWSNIIGNALDSANREIDLLNEYRTRLVADVVTGKLDVRDAAAALPEVDPLAADDEPAEALDADAEADLEDPEAALAEAEA